jgi:2-methylisocitrate lyase-like PEP mutase family enzyme
MSDVLAEICTAKREHVARRKAELPLGKLEAELPGEAPRGFARALAAAHAAGRPALIAEIKKASPSSGVLRAEFDPVALARAYAAAGADCVYPIGVSDPATAAELVAELDVPVNVNLGPGATVAQMAAAGASRISVGPTFHRRAMADLRERAAELLAGPERSGGAADAGE